MHTQLQRHKFNLFPKASEEDFARLLDDMRANGYDATMPITLYQGAILDGWNRYCAATELGLTPATVEFDGDEGAALEYTLRTNKRRNMSSSQWATVAVEADELMQSIRDAGEAARRAEISEARQAGPLVEANETGQFIVQSDDEHATKAATKVAEVFNTNRTYINEAAKLKETSPETFEMVKAGDVSVPLAAQFAALPQEVQQEAIAAIAEHHEPAKDVMREAVHNHRAQGTGENEWYTPQEHIDAAYKVLGTIDLDPASSEIANQRVQAGRIFTIEDDGLAQEWGGKVWMNPPYAQPHIANFIEKLASEYEAGRVTEAIALTHNYTDTQWFHRAALSCSAICFTRGRIGFLSPEGKRAAPTQGQAFFYYGSKVEQFIEAFCRIGFVVEVRNA